jgi:hypothetical protein
MNTVFTHNISHFTIRHFFDVNMDREVRELHCNNTSLWAHNTDLSSLNALKVNDICSPTGDV